MYILTSFTLEFDEILDLSGDNRSAGGVGDAPPQPPIIAFEAPAQQAGDVIFKYRHCQTGLVWYMVFG